MSNQPSGPRRIALSLSLLVAALPALATAQVAKPAAAPAPNPEILPVPLNPLVPAAQRQCSAKTASGLGTRMLREGAGAKPGAGDYVLVNYIGYLATDGTVFDQNVTQAFTTDGVIKGFSEGLLLMKQGSVWRFCIPAALGYGEKGAGPIPANSDLVFQVELVDSKTVAEVTAIRAQAERDAQQQAQQPAGQPAGQAPAAPAASPQPAGQAPAAPAASPQPR
ncbi:MAG: FKBP-type peptidyl-prolyl cis-trans isomerase [Novosphingobium sp.]|uniref:FKBP-type peptidyl-prolyl cis-trans isomerase n=1 Tax=Novosphingobium sp. TaxID=1874826 RepID=UPI00301B3FF1